MLRAWQSRGGLPRSVSWSGGRCCPAFGQWWGLSLLPAARLIGSLAYLVPRWNLLRAAPRTSSGCTSWNGPGLRRRRRGSPVTPHRAGPARRSPGPDGCCRHEAGARSGAYQHHGRQARARRPRPGAGAGRRRIAARRWRRSPSCVTWPGASTHRCWGKASVPPSPASRHAATSGEWPWACPSARPLIVTRAYFCAAELLTNAAKHSSAQRDKLEVRRQAGQVTMRVSDDAAGGARLGPAEPSPASKSASRP